jgi:hypothetical protein
MRGRIGMLQRFQAFAQQTGQPLKGIALAGVQ